MIRLLLILMCLVPGQLLANEDAALYQKGPAANMAFVRLVNANIDETILGLSFKQGNHLAASYGMVTNYEPIASGEYKVTDGSHNFSVTLDASKYYTIGLVDSTRGYVIFEDEAPLNPAKAQISFYNFSSISDVLLYAPNFNATIFDNMAFHTKQTRDINPVEIQFVLGVGQQELGNHQVQLMRNTHNSVFLYGSFEEPQSFVSTNDMGE